MADATVPHPIIWSSRFWRDQIAPIRYSRHTDEGRVAAVEEGAVDHLQDEGEVLERQVRGGGAHWEQQTLQRRHEERQHGGPQVGVLLALTCKQTLTRLSSLQAKELFFVFFF